MKDKETLKSRRYIINIYGIVQGVGFRPYIFNLAKSHDLKGWVKNLGSSVTIDIEGSKENIKIFLTHIINSPPPLASIKKMRINLKKPKGYNDFTIQRSICTTEEIKFISPDIGTCQECVKEIFDKNSPYYNYPFTNCTNCGPRYSIIKRLPYDRENTTMGKFKMCLYCREKYENPLNRRFHAQPTCCPTCGPQYKLIDIKGNVVPTNDPIKEAYELLKRGYILAIKGIGGYHLSCDALNHGAVDLLRKRKKRPHKPFAVMARDVEAVKKICYLDETERRVLTDNKKPIVLLNKKETFFLPDNIAPINRKVGIILPYAPIHYLLLHNDIEYLIMTSGNISGMPIVYKNEDALEHLKEVVDYFLIHNREINIPVEDSVVKVVMDKEMLVRMGRGYSPMVVDTCVKSGILALGAEEKASFSISQKSYVYVSQYLGDLKELNTYNNYKHAIKNLTDILNIKPKTVIHDLHPHYLSTKYSQNLNQNKFSIQHHHGHMVSCMGEHKLFCDVIGVIYDGTGMGVDGNIWGGEIFVGNRSWIKRVGHLKTVDIQGGNSSIKEIWKTALGYLYSMGYDPLVYLTEVDKESLQLTRKALEVKLNCYKSSSMGRFFDCVASLIGLRNVVTYDGQGAMELESIIDERIDGVYSYNIEENKGLFIIDYEEIIREILKEIKNKLPSSIIATKFHNTVCSFTVEAVIMVRKKYNINKVVLSGGVFQNDYLLKNIYKGLNRCGFDVYFNEKIPINDNGLSFGQLIAADSLMGE